MFDLGEYASNIFWSYLTTFILLGSFTILSIRKQKRVRRELEKYNKREKKS